MHLHMGPAEGVELSGNDLTVLDGILTTTEAEAMTGIQRNRGTEKSKGNQAERWR